MTLSGLLSRAGVSRTAYYSLARRSTVLPRSIHALAATLGLAPSAILEEPAAETETAMARLELARAICAREPEADLDTVRHTLALLDLPPIERLNRSLIRGRAAAVQTNRPKDRAILPALEDALRTIRARGERPPP
jgi:hypothetical protein